MANHIEIPAYKTLIANSTYFRKAAPMKHPLNGKEYPATQFLQLFRYITPSEDETIDLIQTAAREFDPNLRVGKDKMLFEEVPLNELMKAFPSEEIERIKSGNIESLMHLRRHRARKSYESGKSYLQAISGILPNEIVEKIERLREERNGMIYTRFIEGHAVSDRWFLRVRLENDSFPNRLELEYLIDRGVRDCDVFKVGGDCENYKTIANQLRILYNTFSSPAQVKMLDDNSGAFLIIDAALTMKDAALCLSHDKLSNDLAHQIGDALSCIVNHFNEDDEDDSKADGWTSLN